MLVSTQDVFRLIREIASKAKVPLEHTYFARLSECINEIPGTPYIRKRYLYQNVFKQTEKALNEGNQFINLNLAYLNRIAAYLDFRDFQDFVQAVDVPIPELRECLGNWISITRCNSGLDRVLISPVRIYQRKFTPRFRQANLVLISPVRIYQDTNKFWLELKGPVRGYHGELRHKSGCIVCLIEAGAERELHLTFKLAAAKCPKVLKGTFSGLSSGGDAIAGREILVREENTPFNELPNRKVDLSEASDNHHMLDPRIIQFFRSYEGNYLKVSQVGSFDLDDLLL